MHATRYQGVLQRGVLIEPILPRPDWYAVKIPNPNPSSLAQGARTRRAVWPSRDEMLNSYRTRPTFEHWRDDVLRLYLDEGVADGEDGQVELKCPSLIESHFFEAVIKVEAWPTPSEFKMPTLALWGANSHLVTRGLSGHVDQALPNVHTALVDDVGRLLPQERSDEVARLNW